MPFLPDIKFVTLTEILQWPEDKRTEFFWYYRWASDLQTHIEVEMCNVAALVVQNLPDELTTLTGLLRSALVAGGLCCTKAIDQHMVDVVGEYQISQMAAPSAPETLPTMSWWLQTRGRMLVEAMINIAKGDRVAPYHRQYVYIPIVTPPSRPYARPDTIT